MSTIFDKKAIKQNCEEFFSLYNETKGKIYDMCELKKVHTQEVATNCCYIAKNIGLSEYDCDLAWIIGELHDFARFGQAIVTKTFRDNDKYNHAKFGARLLFKYGMVDDIIFNYAQVPHEDKTVMEKAVYYHSDLKLPDDLTEREILFCNIIRWADQIDIFRAIASSTFETIYGCSKEDMLSSPDISDAILAAFPRHELADYSKRVTLADYRLAHIAICFGLKNTFAKQRAVEQGYLQQLMDIEFYDAKVQEKYLRAKCCVEEFMQSA